MDAAHAFGVIVRFLPPYSPDLNPIELTFAWVKQQLRLERQEIQGAVLLGEDFGMFVREKFMELSPAMCANYISFVYPFD